MIVTEQLPDGPLMVVDPTGPAPVAAVYLWFPVGSAVEAPDRAGAAHLLEHMVFKGAGPWGPGELVARIEGAGGELNAYTSFEQTVLHATLPASRAPLAVELLAAMGLHPHLDPGALETERTVVMEEIRGVDDDPSQVLADRLRARVWGDHPYGRPILGTEASVAALDRAALADFHVTAYHPGRAVLAVAGPVDLAAVKAAALAALTNPVAPAQLPATQAVAGAPAEPGCFALDLDFDERLVEVAFPLPGHAHDDMAALDLLSVGLGDGASSLLSRRLRDELDVVLSTWAAIESEPALSLLVVGVAAREGRASEAVEGMLSVLARVAREGLPAAVLRRARASVLSERMRDHETVDGRAQRLAWYTAHFGDYRQELAYEAAIRRVTEGDLRRVAAQWLRPGRMVAGAVAPAAELDTATLEQAVARGWSAPAPRVVRGARGPRAEQVADGVWTARLGCGATVLVEPSPDAHLFGLSVVGVGGSLAEGARNAGLATAWSGLLTRGSGDLDHGDYAESVEELAGGVAGWSARNSVGLRASFPARDLRIGLELALAPLVAPRFDPQEVARARADLHESRRLIDDDPGELAWRRCWAALCPAHPWGRSPFGTEASLARLTPGRLRAYHRRVVQGANLVVGLAGAVDPHEAVAQAERLLASLPVGAPHPLGPPRADRVQPGQRRIAFKRAGAPAQILLGFPTVGRGHPDEPALQLLTAVLGGVAGGSGRLFDRVREQHGLAYAVDALAERGLGGGAFFCSVATDPGRTAAVLDAVWSELSRIAAEPVPAEELARVQVGLVEGIHLGLQRAASRADHLAAAQRYDGDGAHYRDRLEAPGRVDAATLLELAARLLQRDRCVQVVVAGGGKQA